MRKSVTFKVKDYRIEAPGRYTATTLATAKFIRRFLIHVLPKGLHRIRHYGLFANSGRADNLAKMRELLAVTVPPPEESETSAEAETQTSDVLARPCPCCGGRMLIIETFEPGYQPRHRPSPPPGIIRIDTS